MAHPDGLESPVISRTDRGRRTADRFVEAAMALVAEQGLEGLTIARVAKSLGYAVGSMYRHFPSKGALLVAMQTRVVEGVRQDLADADARLAGAPIPDPRVASLAALIGAQRAYVDLAYRAPDRFALLALTLGDPRELVDPSEAGALVPALGHLLDDVAARFDRAAETGALSPGDSKRRAYACWASVHGALQLRKLERFAAPGLSAEPLAEALCQTLLAGWGAPPAVLRNAWDAVDARRPRPEEDHR